LGSTLGLKTSSGNKRDGQGNLLKRKRGGVDHIYDSIADAIKSTLGEFDLIGNNSGNPENEIQSKLNPLNFQIEDFLNPNKRVTTGNNQLSSQSSLQKFLMNSGLILSGR
jgi:hypothetical protein